MNRNQRLFRLCAVLIAAFLASCAKPPVPPGFADSAPLPLPSGMAADGPRLSVGPAGQLALSWMERNDQGGTLRYTTLVKGEWQAANDVVTDPDMFVNWADIPSVVPLSGENWLAHWMSKSAEATYAYDVKVSHSTDGGANWSPPILPHKDGTQTEHGFVSIIAANDQSRMIWLDGRKSANEPTGNSVDTGMTLRGGIIDVNGTVSSEQLIDDFVCDCCRTNMAIASTGPIAIYRNRTAEEIRDIYVTRHIDGAWQTGVPLSNDGWKIAACPVNGPAIAAIDDFVAVAWFTAANDKPIVQLRTSTNAGASFGEPILISSQNVVGQVDIEILEENAVAVSWVERTRGVATNLNDVKLMSVTMDGTRGDAHIVGTTAHSRAVPQMTRRDDKLIFVWTDANNDSTELASVSVSVLPAS